MRFPSEFCFGRPGRRGDPCRGSRTSQVIKWIYSRGIVGRGARIDQGNACEKGQLMEVLECWTHLKFESRRFTNNKQQHGSLERR
jgi:hypothetical protein